MTTDPARVQHVRRFHNATAPSRLQRAALLTDGAARAVDELDMCSWPELLDLLAGDGPLTLIRRIRTAERALERSLKARHAKTHDDATAAVCLFPKGLQHD